VVRLLHVRNVAAENARSQNVIVIKVLDELAGRLGKSEVTCDRDATVPGSAESDPRIVRQNVLRLVRRSVLVDDPLPLPAIRHDLAPK
jgi:hypothetical protein